MKKWGLWVAVSGAVVGVLVFLFEMLTGMRKPEPKPPTGLQEADAKIHDLNKKAEDLDAQRKKLLDDINAGRVPRE